MLQQGARLAVGLTVIPLVVRFLGAEMYGAWAMLQQSVGFLGLSDLRPMGTLKFNLAVTQHVSDHSAKRRQVGASVLVWLLTLPVFAVGIVLLVHFAPSFVAVSSENIYAVQLTVGILGISVAFDRILSLPGNVLRGVNLEYKAMGLNAMVTGLGGGIMALSVFFGFGLPGLAFASFIGVSLAGISRLIIARRAITWFGLEKPRTHEVKQFFGRSAWLFFSALNQLLLNSSDILVAGILLGPTTGAVLALTTSVSRLSVEPLNTLLGSGSPGIAGLCGERKWKDVARVREEMLILGLTSCALLGFLIVGFNHAFVRLWVGEHMWGGAMVNFMYVLIAFQVVTFRVDSVIADAMLEFRLKSLAMLFAGVASITFAWLLAQHWSIEGFLLGNIIGRSLLTVYLPYLISKKSGGNILISRSLSRLLLAAALLLVLGGLTNSMTTRISTWFELAICVALLFPLAFAFMWRVGMSNPQRALFRLRFQTIWDNVRI